MIIHILISTPSLFVIILFGTSLIIVLEFIMKMIHTGLSLCVRVCVCVCVSSFWGQSSGDFPGIQKIFSFSSFQRKLGGHLFIFFFGF